MTTPNESSEQPMNKHLFRGQEAPLAGGIHEGAVFVLDIGDHLIRQDAPEDLVYCTRTTANQNAPIRIHLRRISKSGPWLCTTSDLPVSLLFSTQCVKCWNEMVSLCSRKHTSRLDSGFGTGNRFLNIDLTRLPNFVVNPERTNR